MLTPRQRQVAELVARGLSNKAIARETGLSIDTVNSHLRFVGQRVPGPGSPRHKAMVWFFSLADLKEEAA